MGPRSPANASQPKTISPPANLGEPTSPEQINNPKPLDFVAIGWSYRRENFRGIADRPQCTCASLSRRGLR